jgi:hypothetical protein
MRTSSLRHWSLSSTAPSSSSSNPFGRPQSSHTANTSVDLAKFSSIMTSSRSSLDSQRAGGYGGYGGYGAYGAGVGFSGIGVATSSYCAGLDSRLNSPLTSAGISAGGGFNIDDYLSSDDDIDADSFVTPRTKRNPANEEALLFKDDGFGMGGLQLPGLFDALAEVQLPPGSPPSRLSHYRRHSYGSLGRFPRRSRSADARSFAPGYDYDDDDRLSDDDDDDDDDDLDSNAEVIPGRRGMKRLSALGTLYGRIEEENLEKVDVRTAIRLRKEAKALKRARARKIKGKGIEVVDFDEEHLADGEY